MVRRDYVVLPTPRWRLGAAVLLAMVSTPATAATFVEDDFEGPTLLVSESPPGRWTGAKLTTPGYVLGLSPLAARRGVQGLRSSDTDTASGGYGVQVWSSPPAPGGAEAYFRFWARVTPSAGTGGMVLAEVFPYGVANSMADFAVDGTGKFYLGGYDRSALRELSGTVAYRPGEWHLVEVSVTGVGTTAGVKSLWVDGAFTGASTANDWSGYEVGTLYLGEPYVFGAGFTGTVDIDDYRASDRPMASTLSVVAAASSAVGECVEVTIGLEDSVSGAAASAPYEVVLTLSADGLAGGFFSEPTCGLAQPSALAAGAQSTTAYFAATAAGAGSLRASHLDFIGGSVRHSAIAADAVVPPLDRRMLRVGCGCSSAGAQSLLGLGLWALWLSCLKRRQA